MQLGSGRAASFRGIWKNLYFPVEKQQQAALYVNTQHAVRLETEQKVWMNYISKFSLMVSSGTLPILLPHTSLGRANIFFRSRVYNCVGKLHE